MKRNIELENTNQKSGNDIDCGDENGCNGITLIKAGSAIHRAVELGIARYLFAADAGLRFIDQPGVQVGIDCHLLAGHCIQGETRGDFSGAYRSMRNDDVLNGNQRDEDDESDDIIPANNKRTEGLDDVAGGGYPFVPVEENA